MSLLLKKYFDSRNIQESILEIIMISSDRRSLKRWGHEFDPTKWFRCSCGAAEYSAGESVRE